MSVTAALEAALGGPAVPPDLLTGAFEEVMRGEAAPVAVAGLLVALRAKGETVDEIACIARTLRAHAVTADLPDPRTIDTCGTGGDHSGTFNVSTVAAFVVAGAGVPVAKHGNRAATSRSGSADVLEALGVDVEVPVSRAAEILAEIGIAFFFARVAHPAFRHLAPVRAELGVRTVMNCMGPLLNPVSPRFQLVGVYAAELVEPLAQVLGALGSERALVVHGSDGLDEVTLTGPTHAALLDQGRVEAFQLDPEQLGLAPCEADDVRGGDAAENAQIARDILAGTAGPRADLVLANAGAALYAAGAASDPAAGVALARESISSGAARERLARLVSA